MNLDAIFKLAEEQKVNINKPICEKCLVNLEERTVSTDEGFQMCWECPVCHKQQIFECDKEGNVLSTKTIENK